MIARSVLEFSPGAAGPLLAQEDAGEPDWRDLAECQYTDPEIFFPERGGSVREAKSVCQSCAVREECLEYAMENGEPHGVWGGLSEQERRRLARSRPVPLPRRCGKRIHVMTEDNTTPDGKCRTCRRAYEQVRDKGLAA